MARTRKADRLQAAARRAWRPLKVAIIVDPMASLSKSREEEIEDHKETFTRLLAPHPLTFETPMCVNEKTLDADLLVFDFGGMMPGNDLMADNSRRTIRWAQDHPSSLVIVASRFTYAHGVQYEMRELGLLPDDAQLSAFSEKPEPSPLPNVMVFEGYEPEQEKAIRSWFK